MPTFTPCVVCDNREHTSLTSMRAPRIPTVNWPVVVCNSCGLVSVSPHPVAAEYAAINDQWFSGVYGEDSDDEKIERRSSRRADIMWSRIGDSYPNVIKSVLDIGAGRGWGFEMLQKRFPGISMTAIEHSPRDREHLESSYGVEVIATNVSESWPAKIDNSGFDLIIFRHTLEHMLDPMDALKKIEKSLSNNGYAYIVVPNCMRIPKGTRMRTDFFRPVHLYYFNSTTFLQICEKAGLVAEIFGAEGEIWGLFRRKDNTHNGKQVDVGPTINVQQQLDHLQKRLSESAASDRKSVVKICARRMMPEWVIKTLRRIR